MSGSQQKKPLVFIGLAIFIIATILGIIADSIVGSRGKLAVICAGAGLLAFAVFCGIDFFAGKAAQKRAGLSGGNFPYDVPADQRFLRHSDNAQDFSQTGYDGFEDDEYNSFDVNDSQQDFSDVQDFYESPSVTLRRRAAQLRAQQNAADTAATEQAAPEEPLYTPFAQNDSYAAEPQYAEQFDDQYSEQYNDQFDDDMSAAELSQQPLPQQPQQQFERQPESPAPQQEAEAFSPVLSYTAPQPQETPAPAPTNVQPAAAFQPAPQPEPAQPVRPAAVDIPAAAVIPAATVAAPVSAPRSAGQTLESFYDNMSEEDILYRDCVEVWAADAKPAILRLISCVDKIEDKQLHAQVGRDVEYINAMLDRIYCFTQLEYVDELLDLQKYNFSVLVKECLRRFSPFFMEKRLGLLWKGLDIDVMTDRKWFIFALTQVIFNSVEFTPAGGKIAISAKKNGEYIDLMIDDSGKGISQDELPCAFIAGYMGDDAPNESGRRTGMGLFIAQSVLRKMGGDAFIESNYGKGTRVTLRVPANSPVK